jgi:hypothetical protein
MNISEIAGNTREEEEKAERTKELAYFPACTWRSHDLPAKERRCKERPRNAGTYGTLARSTDASRNAGEGVSKRSSS